MYKQNKTADKYACATLFVYYVAVTAIHSVQLQRDEKHKKRMLSANDLTGV